MKKIEDREARDFRESACAEGQRRRQFSAEYKRRILEEVDGCTEPGQVGAVLDRESLYSSHLAHWRRQREKAIQEAMAPKKRGRKKKDRSPLALRAARLEAENELLRKKLRQAERTIEVQKKISEILGAGPNLEKGGR